VQSYTTTQLKLNIWEPGAAPGPTDPKSVVQKCCYTIPSEIDKQDALHAFV